MSREKKSEKKATVERKVQNSSRVVKMNQPWRYGKQMPERRSGDKDDGPSGKDRIRRRKRWDWQP